MATADLNVAMRDSEYHADVAYGDSNATDVLATTININEASAARWSAIIDHPLIEWGRNPGVIDVDGIEAPSAIAISKACKLFAFMRDRVWPLPTGIIADGEGGIVFENKYGPIYQRIEIDSAGLMKLVTFRDNKLLWQEVIDVE